MTEERELTPFEEDVLSLFDKAVDYLAEASAAQAWSTPGDMDLDTHGEELLIVANFGDWWAANGDLVWADETNPGEPGAYGDVGIPSDFIVVSGGGRIPCTEEEISLDHVATRIRLIMEELPEQYALLGHTDADILEILLRKNNGKDLTYTSVSGDATYYARPKPVQT